MKTTFKSISAVIAGFFIVVVLSTLMDLVMETVGIFPSVGQQLSNHLLAIALLYRVVFTILAGYVTAILAPSQPMKHVTILGIIGLIGGGLGVIAGWNLSAHWYPILIFLTAFPSVWIGGKLKRA